MSVYSQFSILPFDKPSKKFIIDDAGKVQSFEKSDSDTILLAMKKDSSSFLKKVDAKKLQDAINKAINKYSQQFNLLIDKIINELDNELLKSLNNLGVIERQVGTIKLNTAKARQYEQEVLEISNTFFSKNGVHDTDIAKAISRINGSLSKVRGDIFENFLSIILNNSKAIINNLTEANIDNLVELFGRNLSTYNRKGVKIIDKNNKSSEVTGDKTKDKIIAYIDDKMISVSGAQGKTDVAIEGLNGDFLGISAKNYTGSRRISLLSEGNLVGLVSQWPGTSDHIKNLALNGLSAASISGTQYKLMKKIFLVQALMGTKNEPILSQLFIINRNTPIDPILVFSVYDLLFNDETNFKGRFSKIKPIAKLPRELDDFINFINNTKISIKTELTLSKLANLAQ